MKVATIVGTRPEIIRLSQVIRKLEKSVEHVLIHTGQNYDYELNEIFFDDLNLKKPDYYLDAVGNNSIETIGRILIETNKVLTELKPDAVLILGDTNSCLSSLVAKRLKIPVFHMEAGNRCFDDRVPEEINRRIVDHISDVNFPYSTISRDYLVSEGIHPKYIIKTGSPMFEVINQNIGSIESSTILEKLSLEKGEYFIVSAHREENIDNPKLFIRLMRTLDRVCKKFKKRVIFSTHPRTQKRVDELNFSLDSRIEFLKPLSFTDYNKLQMNAAVVISDSGTINEEAAILKFNAINIREAHERPEAMEVGTTILTGVDEDVIIDSIECLMRNVFEKPALVNDYNIDNVSDVVVKNIIGYSSFVKREKWKMYD